LGGWASDDRRDGRDHAKRVRVEAFSQKVGSRVRLNRVRSIGESGCFFDMTDEQWTSVLDITLNSVFRMTRVVLPHMIERKFGAENGICRASASSILAAAGVPRWSMERGCFVCRSASLRVRLGTSM